MNRIIKIAHRGYSLLKKKENTLFAFQNAIKKNFNMIELDVQLSKSNDLIIHHDDYIVNNDEYYYIKDLTYDEINVMNPYIITLPFFFKNIDKEKIKVYLDIKGEHKIIKPLLNYLDSEFDDFNNLLLASFNRNSIKETIKFNKNKNNKHPKYLETGFITENTYTNEELKLLLKDIEYIIVHWTMLNNELINFCKKNNKKVYCYTLKDKEQLKIINKYDVDGIVSDILF